MKCANCGIANAEPGSQNCTICNQAGLVFTAGGGVSTPSAPIAPGKMTDALDDVSSDQLLKRAYEILNEVNDCFVDNTMEESTMNTRANVVAAYVALAGAVRIERLSDDVQFQQLLAQLGGTPAT